MSDDDEIIVGGFEGFMESILGGGKHTIHHYSDSESDLESICNENTGSPFCEDRNESDMFETKGNIDIEEYKGGSKLKNKSDTKSIKSDTKSIKSDTKSIKSDTKSSKSDTKSIKSDTVGLGQDDITSTYDIDETRSQIQEYIDSKKNMSDEIEVSPFMIEEEAVTGGVNVPTRPASLHKSNSSSSNSSTSSLNKIGSFINKMYEKGKSLVRRFSSSSNSDNDDANKATKPHSQMHQYSNQKSEEPPRPKQHNMSHNNHAKSHNNHAKSHNNHASRSSEEPPSLNHHQLIEEPPAPNMNTMHSISKHGTNRIMKHKKYNHDNVSEDSEGELSSPYMESPDLADSTDILSDDEDRPQFKPTAANISSNISNATVDIFKSQSLGGRDRKVKGGFDGLSQSSLVSSVKSRASNVSTRTLKFGGALENYEQSIPY